MKQATIAKKMMAKLDQIRNANKEKPTVWVNDRGNICVSAEDGLGFADYYGEFNGGYQFVAPELNEIASQFGGYWEWENCATIIFDT